MDNPWNKYMDIYREKPSAAHTAYQAPLDSIILGVPRAAEGVKLSIAVLFPPAVLDGTFGEEGEEVGETACTVLSGGLLVFRYKPFERCVSVSVC